MVFVPGTTVGQARLNILAAIQTQTASLSLPSGYSLVVQLEPLGQNAPEQRILVGRARVQNVIESFVGSGGQHWIDERYTIEVTCFAFRGGEDQASTFTDCVALVNAVQTAVRNDPSLGLAQGSAPAGMGYVIQAYPARLEWTTDWSENGQGIVVECLVEVDVMAHL